MKTVRSIGDLESALVAERGQGDVGFVPTMGALHAGHAALIETASSECACVVVSDFVNPTQFDDPDDLAAYPRDTDADALLANDSGCDVFWIPSIEEMYPGGPETTVTVDEDLTTVLCGAKDSRGPEHFAGVTTIVSRLFDLVRPDRAYFGEKDAQQLAVVRRMVEERRYDIEIRPVPTVRDQDGLALSSRNTRLEPSDRKRALAIPKALSTAHAAAVAGETSAEALVSMVWNSLSSAGIEAEYVEARDPTDLTPVSVLNGSPVLLAVAAEIGGVRLIDNELIEGGNHE